MSVPAALDTAERPDTVKLTIYISALVAMFLSSLDMQIVVTALPTIAGELGNLHLFGWVGSAYMLSTAAVSPIYGKLGDLFGRKRVLIVAISLFLVGSLTCGLAWSMESLIAARVLQGLGGGGLMVSAFAVIGELFEPRIRARYQGFSSAVFALSSVLGPTIGGYITEAAGWRWVFLVNLPIGLGVLGVLTLVMKSKPSGARRSIDYAGGLLLALATTTIVYWCDHVFDPAGPDLWTYLLPAIGLAALGAFVAVERRAAEPIIPLGLFGNRTVTLSMVLQILSGAATLGMFFYLALFIQTVTGLSPAVTGMLFMPSSISAMLTSMLSGLMISRTGRYKLLPVLGNAGGALITFAFTLIDATTPLWLIATLMAGFGISLGLSMQVLLTAVQHAAPGRHIGAATGLLTQSRTVGVSLGLAINGAILSLALSAQTRQLAPATAALVPEGLGGLSPHALADLPAERTAEVLSHYSAGFHTMFIWVSGLYLAAALVAVLLPNILIPKRG